MAEEAFLPLDPELSDTLAAEVLIDRLAASTAGTPVITSEERELLLVRRRESARIARST